MIYWAVILAVVWTTLQGEFTVGSLLGGFVLALVILRFLRPFESSSPVRWHPYHAMVLFFVFMRDLVISNFQVAKEILSREPLLGRAILRIPLDPDTDCELSTLGNMVTLTPGTLTLHVARDRSALYIHSLLATPENEANVRQSIKDLEAKVREAVL